MRFTIILKLQRCYDSSLLFCNVLTCHAMRLHVALMSLATHLFWFPRLLQAPVWPVFQSRKGRGSVPVHVLSMPLVIHSFWYPFLLVPLAITDVAPLVLLMPVVATHSFWWVWALTFAPCLMRFIICYCLSSHCYNTSDAVHSCSWVNAPTFKIRRMRFA